MANDQQTEAGWSQRVFGTGPAVPLGCLGLILSPFLVGGLLLNSYCSGQQPKQDQEVTFEAIKAQREEAAAEGKRKAFENRQTPLWNSPRASIDRDRLIKEMSKCESAIQENGSHSPYAMIFSDYDDAKALRNLKSGSDEVDVIVQQKDDFLNKVAFTRYACNFRGIGYESFSDMGSQFSDRYIPN